MSGLPPDFDGMAAPAPPARPAVIGLFGRVAGSVGWMVTFADLLALLVSFFVLLFATTTVEPGAWRRVVQPMRPYMAGTVLHPQDSAPVLPSAAPPARHDLNYLEVLLRQLQGADPLLAGMSIDRREHALTLRPPAVLLTTASNQEPAETARARADLMRLLAGLDNRLEIVVHGLQAEPTGTTNTAEIAAQPWRRALDAADAAIRALVAGGVERPVEATALVDQPATAIMRSEIVVHDLGAAAPVDDGAAQPLPGTAKP